MKRFKLSDLQAESILNMRLRALRKLEEEGIRTEFTGLEGEKDELEKRLGARLINRTTRTSSLTEAGDSYYRQVQKVVDHTDLATSQILCPVNWHCL